MGDFHIESKHWSKILDLKWRPSLAPSTTAKPLYWWDFRQWRWGLGRGSFGHGDGRKDSREGEVGGTGRHLLSLLSLREKLSHYFSLNSLQPAHLGGGGESVGQLISSENSALFQLIIDNIQTINLTPCCFIWLI